eukprot:gene10115-2534_t
MGNIESQRKLDCELKGEELSLKNITEVLEEIAKFNFKILNLSQNQISYIHPSLKNKKIEEIKLNSCKLTSLPQNLTTIESLTKLNLSTNKLQKDSTQEIVKLKNLTDLNLSFNCLEEFEGFEGSNLIKLNLTSCNLKKLSNKIFQIASLEELELIRNFDLMFEELDENINSKLRKLSISNSKFIRIPEVIFHLISLVHLDVSYNKITELSKIDSLRNLVYLDLSNNKLNVLPSEFKKLEKLKLLDLSNNDFTEFPLVLKYMKNINEIIISSNRIEKFPEMDEETNLKIFKSKRCGLRDVPGSFITSYLKNTTLISFESNKIQELPSFKSNEYLERLDINDNELEQIPEIPKSLEDLSVQMNKIQEIPDILYDISALKQLNLGFNQLTKIDEKLSQLKNLEYLYLDHNPLLELPSKEILTLSKLKKLSCSETGILAIPDEIKEAIETKNFESVVNFKVSFPDKIIDKLYLGSMLCSSNRGIFDKLQIKAVMVVGNKLETHFPESVKYKVVEISDTPSENLFAYFEECIDFIHENMKNGSVLVHCAAGISRSATIVISYLMKIHKMNLNDAMNHVTDRRSIVSPNYGFMKQLEKYEQILQKKV